MKRVSRRKSKKKVYHFQCPVCYRAWKSPDWTSGLKHLAKHLRKKRKHAKNDA